MKNKRQYVQRVFRYLFFIIRAFKSNDNKVFEDAAPFKNLYYRNTLGSFWIIEEQAFIMVNYNLSDPFVFLLITILMFLVIVLRYFIVAGIFFTIFYIWNPDHLKKRKIHHQEFNKRQYLKEVRWSMVTSIIFALSGALTALAWQKGYSKVYTDIAERGIIYFIFSLLLMMFIHETYYYWMHRLMHQKKVFKYVHKVHHDSIITSPWTAFSFHPTEGLIQAIFLPLMLFLLPVHYYAILMYLTLMTFSSVINHLNVEVYPKGFENNLIGKYLIGASHHSLHHSQYKTNYGLYFNIWDRLMGTQSAEFEKLFRNKTGNE